MANRETDKQRNSNLELFRILVMMMIIAHHYVVNSGLYEIVAFSPSTVRNFFFLNLGAWGKTGINCFVLITGYFMCEKKISSRKFIQLLLEVYFYRIAIWGIFILSGYSAFSAHKLFRILMPISGLNQNFISCYLAFFLLIPFLNILVRNLNKSLHQTLVLLLILLYSIQPLLLLDVAFNYVTWFCALYIISSYLKRYPLRFDSNTKFWGIASAICIATGMLSILSITALNQKYGMHVPPYFFLSDSNKLLSLVIAICLFMFFKNLKMKQSKIINTVATSCFGVLLIHANSDTMRNFLWKDIVNCVGNYEIKLYWLYTIAVIILVYITCTIIDYIRKHTIEKPCVDYAESLYEKIKHAVINKYCSING